YDEVVDPPPPQKQMEGLTIPTFPQLYRKVKGTPPSGPYWEAYRTLYEMNNALLRLVALPPGAPRSASGALSACEAFQDWRLWCCTCCCPASGVLPIRPEPPHARGGGPGGCCLRVHARA